ncbi:MAG: acyl--CoA ligase [Deltaproteobacteria bacterium]|nr:acyl--CoA ligase [Deltaproteobacteria bacterium]
MLRAPTLGELLQSAAQQHPQAGAFRYRSESINYAEWNDLSGRLAAAFAARDIRRGDVVALLLPSTPLYLIAYLAAARLGAVTAGINARYRRTEIGHILRRSGARLLLAVERWHDADFRTAVEGQAGGLPELKDIIWICGDDLRRDTRAVVGHVAGDCPPAHAIAVEPDDPVAIIFTSGTTGIPKGAWYSHRNLLALAEIDTRRYAGGEIPFRKHLAAGLSFAHIGTMARIAIQIGHRGLSIIHDAFDPAAVLEVIESERLQHLGGIPTQIVMLLDHPDRSRRDLSSLRTVLLGGAPSSPELIRRIQRELGVVISMRYSSTEVGIATASLPDDSAELLTTTVGKATPGVELRIVDANNRPLPVDDVGEVTVRSPATMRGYWHDPQATAAVLDADGWIHTGDLGFLDATGYLHLRGRQSEMFIRGGYNVYPGEVENLLAKHPKVARAAVLGVPDEKFGEIGWAFVVPRSTTEPPSLEELRRFVGADLASFKRPDGLSVVRDLPVTPMFKIDKRALRALYEGGPHE